MAKFSTEYEKDGIKYDRHIEAKDFEEAEAKTAKIPIKGIKVTGKLVKTIETDLVK
jgi:hypothetical protein